MSEDRSLELQQRIQAAVNDREMLRIVGGNSKSFYGNTGKGEVIESRIHNGIINYQPTELVITARAGTSLKEIEATLAKNNQMLPFEPPHFNEHATLGGIIASGLSGPRRPYTGSVRDFVLGVKIITGKGDIMHFGGEVMKNVAGYDVSRLMVGAMGTLGMLLEVSLKVLPLPVFEQTQCLSITQNEANTFFNQLSTQSLPVSAASYDGEQLFIRLSGAHTAVTAAAKKIGGEQVIHAEHFWQQVKEHTHPFFNTTKPLWRLSVPLGSDNQLNEECFVDWAGAQHWVKTELDAESIRGYAESQGGHATLFKSDMNIERFHPLTAKVKQLHLNLKMKFDPYGILNFGRLYQDL